LKNRNLSYAYVRKQVGMHVKCWVAEMWRYKQHLRKKTQKTNTKKPPNPVPPTVWNRYLY